MSGMRKPLSAYSGEERQKIAALAKRSVRSEVKLILSAGFSLLMVVSFFFGAFTFLPLSEATGIRPTIIWAAMSFTIAAVWAFLHGRRVGPRIQEAQELNAAFLYDYETQVMRERRAKAKALRKDQ